MLLHRQDVIACQFAVHYMQNITVNLFEFALVNQNEIFLKFALNEALFGPPMFKNESIKKEISELL